MNKFSIHSKLMLILALTALSHTITAQSRLFLKNDSGWDIAIKFADPKDTRAVESPIPSRGIYSLGTVNDMYDIVRLSVSGTSFLSSFTGINVEQLKRRTKELLSKELVSGYERDIYWVILPTYTGWVAKVEAIQRLK